MTPTDAHLVAGFLLREFDRFAAFLDDCAIDPTEAAIIIEEIAGETGGGIPFFDRFPIPKELTVLNKFEQCHEYEADQKNFESCNVTVIGPDAITSHCIGCPYNRFDETASRTFADQNKETVCAGRSTSGSELIAAERKRQIEEKGFTAQHDAGHSSMCMAVAGAAYALDAAGDHHESRNWRRVYKNSFSSLWPWDEEWFKPTPEDPVRQLVKAGALIAAEIDRIQNR